MKRGQADGNDAGACLKLILPIADLRSSSEGANLARVRLLAPNCSRYCNVLVTWGFLSHLSLRAVGEQYLPAA
jgi:hypothetical protein